jgi:hypothetical protein
MRVEPAIILATVGSLIPGGLIALLGDAPAKYGFILLLIALPFYCFGIICLVFLIDVARRYFRLTSVRSYVICAVSTGLLSSLAVVPEDGWWSAVTFGVSVTIAVLLVPFIQGKRDRADV